LKSPEPLIVVSPFLAFFGIVAITVDTYQFPQEAGYYNQQRFRIECSSHVPDDIIIEQNIQETNRQNSISAFVEQANTLSQSVRDGLNAALDDYFERGGTGLPKIN